MAIKTEEGKIISANYYIILEDEKIDKWYFDINFELTKIDAKFFQLIAIKANPTTKYKTGFADLPVVGY